MNTTYHTITKGSQIMVQTSRWPVSRLPISNITPFTYRDRETYQSLLTRLAEYITTQLHPNLRQTVEEIVEEMEHILADQHGKYVEGVQDFQRIHDAFMADVNASLMALNDTAVSDLVEDDTSLLGQVLRRTFEPYGEVHRNTYDRMGVVVPSELTFDQLQEAADEAAATGKRLWAAGEITTNQTLVIECDADLGQLTINYTGDDVAVVIGGRSTVLQHTAGTTPRVHNPGRDWSKNTVGIQFLNVYSSVWNITLVDGFAVGMDVIGDSRGNVYNTFTIGHLLANRINQRLRGINGGWSNQNTYIGGRYSHLASQGSRVPGSRHIEMTESGSEVNNNLWLNPSVEGGVAEYAIYFSGTYNLVMNGRFEGSPRPRVYWHESAIYNHIFMGYQAQAVIEEPLTSTLNTITTTNMQRITGGTSSGNLRIRNSSSTNAPGYVLHGIDNTIDNVDGYSVWQGQRETLMKTANDTHPRVRISHTAGFLSFGDGTEAPSMSIGAYGKGFRVNGLANPDAAPLNGNTGATDLPTRPQGYLDVYVDGSRAYIPYYRA